MSETDFANIVWHHATVTRQQRERQNGHKSCVLWFSLPTCESRDVKGLYKKARAGEIKNYIGIDSPYEEPENPELVVDTERLDLEASVRVVMDTLRARGILS